MTNKHDVTKVSGLLLIGETTIKLMHYKLNEVCNWIKVSNEPEKPNVEVEEVGVVLKASNIEEVIDHNIDNLSHPC